MFFTSLAQRGVPVGKFAPRLLQLGGERDEFLERGIQSGLQFRGPIAAVAAIRVIGRPAFPEFTLQLLQLPPQSVDLLVLSALVLGFAFQLGDSLLGGKVAAFDMRAPDRIYMRIPGREKQAAVVDAGAAKKKEN